MSTVQSRKSTWGERSREMGETGGAFPDPGAGGGLQLHLGAEGQADLAGAGEAVSADRAGFGPSPPTPLSGMTLCQLHNAERWPSSPKRVEGPSEAAHEKDLPRALLPDRPS